MHKLQQLHKDAQKYLSELPRHMVMTTKGLMFIHGNSQSHADQRAKSMGYKVIK